MDMVEKADRLHHYKKLRKHVQEWHAAGMACRGFTGCNNPGGPHIRTETYAYESAQTLRQSSRRPEARDECSSDPDQQRAPKPMTLWCKRGICSMVWQSMQTPKQGSFKPISKEQHPQERFQRRSSPDWNAA